MDPSYYTVIFLTLNIIFISGMMYFVYSSSRGTLVYEQLYAKEIALFLDSAMPGMELVLNLDRGFMIGRENHIESGLVTINQELGEVTVKLKESGGYRMAFFTDYNIDLKEEPDRGRIVITVMKNEK